MKVNINTLWKDAGYTTDLNKLYKLQDNYKPLEKLSKKEIKTFLDRQEVNQLFNRKPRKLVGHIVAYGGNELLQMDLLDFQKLKTRNRGYAWILIAVDVFTRYAYAIPLKKKTMTETRDGIVKLLSQLPKSQPLPKRIISDNGNEFLNKEVGELFDLYNITHDTNEVGDHNALGIIDRFSRTIRERLERHFSVNKTDNWVDYIDDIVKSYNNTPHSTLHMRTPASILKDDEEILADNIDKGAYEYRAVPRLKVGDLVRKSLKKNIFSKGTKQQYTKETFKVTGVKIVNAELNDGSIQRIDSLLKVVPIEEVID
eukprot:TRINITY_DN6978_c1_g1_i1.p2 TRINITY_DN6978_c1_g1~~TRINITY_DN6978_c1_g1_i1.p2  ORF type:complete len:313 (+),score=-32.54 TRINITY_DN6978_c1_g1_i1:1599-2537(+)